MLKSTSKSLDFTEKYSSTLMSKSSKQKKKATDLKILKLQRRHRECEREMKMILQNQPTKHSLEEMLQPNISSNQNSCNFYNKEQVNYTNSKENDEMKEFDNYDSTSSFQVGYSDNICNDSRGIVLNSGYIYDNEDDEKDSDYNLNDDCDYSPTKRKKYKKFTTKIVKQQIKTKPQVLRKDGKPKKIRKV